MVEYRREVKVEAGDFNSNGQLKLSAALFYFQEAATEHAEILGIGGDELMKRNLVWILAKMKVRFLDNPAEGENCYVMTYPREPKSRFCPRDYYLYGADGRLIAMGCGIWSLMDWTTRKITRADIEFGPGLREDEAFPEGFEKIRIRDAEKVAEYVIAPDDIDANEHTNNCKYGNLVELASTINEIGDFVIQYSKETREGELVELFMEATDGCQLVCGKLQEGETVFQALVTTR